MKFTDISNDVNDWFNGAGPMSDIVISSRVRLARNLAGYKFLARCSDSEKQEILDKLKEAMLSLKLDKDLSYISVDDVSSIERHFLVERHLISQHHAFGKGPRGVVVGKSESFAGMINEEDHLRLQVLSGGLQLKSGYERILKVDEMLEERIDYAFHPRFGFLTACPTNLGTGIRVSVMLHLPALKMANQVDKLFNAAKSMNLAVRGLFGEGTEASGDFYQLSNQVTLGVSEQELVSSFEESVIPKIVEYEVTARKWLLADNSDILNDKISRAMALLRHAHLISSKEALFLLSHLRLGVNMRDSMGVSSPAIEKLQVHRPDASGAESLESTLSIKTINRLFMLTLPAHLQLNCGRELDVNGRDALRAKIIRSWLSPDRH